MRIVVSLIERDRVRHAGQAASLLDPCRSALCQAGLEAVTIREVTPADVACLGSSWAKRLGVPTRRPAWLLVGRKRAGAAAGVRTDQSRSLYRRTSPQTLARR